jgi:hypothetical protein
MHEGSPSHTREIRRGVHPRAGQIEKSHVFTNVSAPYLRAPVKRSWPVYVVCFFINNKSTSNSRPQHVCCPRTPLILQFAFTAFLQIPLCLYRHIAYVCQHKHRQNIPERQHDAHTFDRLVRFHYKCEYAT